MRSGPRNQEPRCPGLLNLGSWFHRPGCIEICIEKLNFDAPGPEEPKQRFKSPGHLGSWFHGPGCIEVQFSMQISMQPDLWNQDPRFKSPGHLGSWFLVPRAWLNWRSVFQCGFQCSRRPTSMVNYTGRDPAYTVPFGLCRMFVCIIHVCEGVCVCVRVLVCVCVFFYWRVVAYIYTDRTRGRFWRGVPYIFINKSISINTNTHIMICIRRNIRISITLEFRIRIEISINNSSMNISSNITVTMSTSVHRSISIQLNFNSGIIICIKAEAVTGTRMHPKPKKHKTKVSRSMRGQFCFFGFLFFFWIFCFYYIAKPKNQISKNLKIQKTKKQNCPCILRETSFFVSARVWFWTDEMAETRYLWKSTKSPVGTGALKGMVCHGGGGWPCTYIYMLDTHTHIYTHTCMHAWWWWLLWLVFLIV